MIFLSIVLELSILKIYFKQKETFLILSYNLFTSWS